MANDPADLLARYRRLTPRQQTVVRHLADAASRAEIAEALGISLSLVDKETAEVMRAFDLQEEGLTRAQRCVELRRMYLQIRRLERSEAAPVAPAGGEPVTAPPPIPASEPTVEQPTPLVLLPPPIPTPLASSSPWRWWPLAAAVLLLAIGIGVWRSAQARSSEHDTLVNLTATAITTAESTPAVAIIVPVPTPTVAPVPTMTPKPPSPTPAPTTTPAPTATATVNPAATPLNLAGKVASTLPGTPLRLGQPVTSVVDQGAKPRDMYVVTLHAGQTFTVQVTAAGPAFSVLLGAPGTFPSYAAASISTTILCSFQEPCQKAVPVATDGAYPLLIEASGPGVQYTLQATAR